MPASPPEKPSGGCGRPNGPMVRGTGSISGWSRSAAPFRAPGRLDASLLAKSDGYATGLIVYTLREAGLPVDHPAVRKGLQWLRANQQDVQVGQQIRPAWRTHSINYDREHGGEEGEPWPRMFMSDAATAFSVLALVGSD